MLYLSGQIGSGPDGKLCDGLEAQSRQTMENIAAALAACGADMRDVVKCTVMLADMTQWQVFNRVYLTFFDPARLPARSAFGAAGLVAGALVEVECIAYAPR
jgi:2-iminobutanoate/2-iminopropanoate deaminase